MIDKPETSDRPMTAVTRSGRNVRIISYTAGTKQYPIVGVIEGLGDVLAYDSARLQPLVSCWTSAGFFFEQNPDSPEEDDFDLILPKKKTVGYKRYIYDNGCGCRVSTLSDGESLMEIHPDFTRWIDNEWQYEEV